MTKLKVLVSLALGVTLVAGGASWWFLRADAPGQVSLESAKAGLLKSSNTSTSLDAEPPDKTNGITGTWAVDTASGDFDYESATGTFVGFRIEEELLVGSATAVGRTGAVTGTMTVDGATVTAAEFDFDMTTITTNQKRRDDQVQSALETDQHPTASFVLTKPIELGEGAESGAPVSVVATGDLTIHGVTQTVDFPLDAQLIDGTVIVVGSTEITFSDYEVEVPSGAVVISVEDHGILELQLLLIQI